MFSMDSFDFEAVMSRHLFEGPTVHQSQQPLHHLQHHSCQQQHQQQHQHQQHHQHLDDEHHLTHHRHQHDFHPETHSLDHQQQHQLHQANNVDSTTSNSSDFFLADDENTTDSDSYCGFNSDQENNDSMKEEQDASDGGIRPSSPVFGSIPLGGSGQTHSLSWHRKGDRNANGRYFARIWRPEDPRSNHRNIAAGPSTYATNGIC
uniref:Uncharacterized protein n=1 Tax=Anopheles stephensi TaxID=30069 RepID=A0A182Y5A9_ANOST